MNLARRCLTTGLLGPPPERDYLAFDGSVDRMHAQGVRSVGGTQYALVTKLQNTAAAGANSYVAHLSDPTIPGASGNHISDALGRIQNAGDRYRALGFRANATSNYSLQSPVGATTAAHLMCVGRNLAADTARVRVLQSDGTILYAPADPGASEDSQPTDLVIGCATNQTFSPFAGTFYAIGWIASVILSAIPTDVQLQAYARGKDARVAFGDSVVWYAAASSLVGSGPIPPIVGTAPLILTGLTSADLVPL